VEDKQPRTVDTGEKGVAHAETVSLLAAACYGGVGWEGKLCIVSFFMVSSILLGNSQYSLSLSRMPSTNIRMLSPVHSPITGVSRRRKRNVVKYHAKKLTREYIREKEPNKHKVSNSSTFFNVAVQCASSTGKHLTLFDEIDSL
jgi:hypothetical protein